MKTAKDYVTKGEPRKTPKVTTKPITGARPKAEVLGLGRKPR
jgi:hypothetical protein